MIKDGFLSRYFCSPHLIGAAVEHPVIPGDQVTELGLTVRGWGWMRLRSPGHPGWQIRRWIPPGQHTLDVTVPVGSVIEVRLGNVFSRHAAEIRGPHQSVMAQGVIVSPALTAHPVRRAMLRAPRPSLPGLAKLLRLAPRMLTTLRPHIAIPTAAVRGALLFAWPIVPRPILARKMPLVCPPLKALRPSLKPNFFRYPASGDEQ